jgi:hypothetical protein
MNWTVRARTLLGTCALAVGMCAAGCGEPSERADVQLDADGGPIPGQPHADAAEHGRAPMTLVGCLQRAERGDSFRLTGINIPSDRPIATSGGSERRDEVERERAQAEQHTYALSGEDDRWDSLVGKRVRVRGTLTEPTGLTRQSDPRSERLGIDQHDLAEVDVESVVTLADGCGSSR